MKWLRYVCCYAFFLSTQVIADSNSMTFSLPSAGYSSGTDLQQGERVSEAVLVPRGGHSLLDSNQAAPKCPLVTDKMTISARGVASK